MESPISAVLINVSGIQDYIFSGKKLKENLGASYIIENLLYNELMNQTIIDLFPDGEIIIDWKKSKEIAISTNPDVQCEVGYVGGGNALVLFRTEKNLTSFIKEFSEKALCIYPGIQLNFGKNENFSLSEDKYKDSFIELHKNLKQRKSEHYFQSQVPKYGITSDCPWSNGPAEIAYQEDSNITQSYISRSSLAKTKIADELAKDNQQLLEYPALKDAKFTLTQEIEKLGQPETSSYIAVVHLDGNGMGKKFNEVKNLTELRQMSQEVSSRAKSAMNEVIKELLNDENIEILSLKSNDSKSNDSKPKKIYLPIRPILVGGDDITFITEGRIGMYLAELFIRKFYDKNLMDGVCAGVAIVKTHFPFYKAVLLAEDLCKEAKIKVRGEVPQNASFISYYYSSSTFAGSIEQLRERSHIVNGKSMYNGPYKVDGLNDDNIENAPTITNLKRGIMELNLENKWPKNKIMKLREAIGLTSDEQNFIEKELIEAGCFEKNEKIWIDSKTKYFDQIELMDFYLPKHLIQ